MTPEKLNKLEQLYKESTKGPWESEACNPCRQDEAYQALKTEDGKTIADCCNSELIEIHRDYDDDELGAVHYWDETGRKNLAFIAAAHEHVPELIGNTRMMIDMLEKSADTFRDLQDVFRIKRIPKWVYACELAETAIRAAIEKATGEKEQVSP